MNRNKNNTLKDWKQMKVLGRGGFGEVTLWHNSFTCQKIAVKKLLECALKDPTAATKITERWCNEVEIMKKLNHINIVAALEIPAEISMTNPLPLLAMEYCSRGNLRQVLNKAENCCGLCEAEILNILRDISSGLAYLHSCKIIHRDLKPDNIVLQEKDSNIIYKLIDLGYAKALDQSSLSESFVGTAQYIAPELFMGKAYTSSVDYWSFGLMAHEIITGYRPFLPGLDPSEWMKQIKNKSRSTICVLENYKGEIVSDSKISKNNHLSRCFLEDIEKWLRLALDWDGQTRGRDLETNRLVFFENLAEIICKKFVNVFSLPTYEFLSYQVSNETDISDLRGWLKIDVDLDEDDQLLLLPSGKCLNMKGNLLKNMEVEKPNGSGASLFLCNLCSTRMRIDKIEIPVCVSTLKECSSSPLPYRQLKRCWTDSIFFLQSQVQLYRNFLQGIRVKITNTKHKTLAVESLFEDLENEWNRIESYGHFLSFSLKIDLENYIHYRKAGKLESSTLVQKWIRSAVEVNSKIVELKNTFNKTNQRQLMLLVKQLCRNLDDHSSKGVSNRIPLDSIVEEGQNLLENLRKPSKTDGELLQPNSAFVQLINKAIEEANNLFDNQMLKMLFAKISEADENLAKFLSQLSTTYKSTNLLKRLIENTQAERQKETWSLIGNSKPNENKLHIKSTDLETSNAMTHFKTDRFCLSTPAICSLENAEHFSLKESKIKKDNGSNDSFTYDSEGEFFSPNVKRPPSVVEDNHQLRYRIQEVQQNCNKMVQEMSSLNWDFILESEDIKKY